MQQNFKSKLQSLSSSLITAGLVFVSRLGYLPANISPLGSYGFFGKKKWLFFTIIVLFDWKVGGFYPGFWITYLGFAMYPLLGKIAKNTTQKLFFLPVASFLFFLISNLGAWWYWYPQNWQGLTSCYLLALPFYTRSLLGDLVFGYGYILAKKYLPLQLTKLTKVVKSSPLNPNLV